MIDKFDPKLTDFVLGELDASEVREVEKAISENPELGKAIEEIRATINGLESAFASESILTLADDQKAALEAAVNAGTAESPTTPAKSSVTLNPERRFYRERLFYWTTGIAAALALMMIPLGMFQQIEAFRPNVNVAELSESTKESVENVERAKQLAMIPESAPAGSLPPTDLKFSGSDFGSSMADAIMDESMVEEDLEMAEDRFQTSDGAHSAGRSFAGKDMSGDEQRGFSNQLEDRPAVRELGLQQAKSEEEPQKWFEDHDGEQEKLGAQRFEIPRENLARDADYLEKSDDSLGRSPMQRNARGQRPLEEFDVGGEEDDAYDSPVDESVQMGADLEPAPARLPAGGSAVIGNTAEGPTQSLRLLESNPMDDDLHDSLGNSTESVTPLDSEASRPRWSRGRVSGQRNGQQPGRGEGQQVPGLQGQAPGQGEGQQAGGQGGGRHPVQQSGRDQNQGEGRESENGDLVDSVDVRDQVSPTKPASKESIRSFGLTFYEHLGEQLDPENEKTIELRKEGKFDYFYLDGKKTNVELQKLFKEATEANEDLRGLEDDGIAFDELKLQLGEKFKSRNEAVIKRKKKNKTWKKVKATPNTTRLMVGDKDELEMNGMQVNVQVDGFRARVLLDYFFYNHHPRQLEGTFKLRLPDDASLYYFAFGQSVYEYRGQGKLADEEFLGRNERYVSLRPAEITRSRQNDWQHVKEARMVPKEKAAHAYNQTVRRRVDPALVEWSGAGVFNARIFPLMPNKLHRVVIGYDVDLTRTADGWVYELPLPASTGDCRVNLNVLEMEGVEFSVTPKVDAEENARRVFRLTEAQANQIRKLSQQRQQLLERFGKEHPKVLEIDKKIDEVSEVRNEALADEAANQVRESQFHFSNPDTDVIRLELTGSNALLLHSNDKEEGNFWATKVQPDLPKVAEMGSERAVFLVDTSLSSRPDKFNVWLKMLEATLSNNRDSLKEFAVVFFNVENHFWKEGYIANTPENVNALNEHCQTLALEGATDLYAALDAVSATEWVTNGSQPDLFLLSDGAANWGETNLRLMSGILQSEKLGSLFAYQSGMTGTAISSLRFMASESGGAVFSVTSEDEIKTASTAHRNRPWQVAKLEADGATDLMTAGRVQWIYPGQAITIVGRMDEGSTELGSLKLELKQGNDSKSLDVLPKQSVPTGLASRLYGQVAVGQLESLGDDLFDVATAYARHFRVTGQTCSLLMLESEADYQRFNIKPEEDLFVIKSKNAEQLVSKTLSEKAEELSDPKQQLVAWLKRLENMPGMKFKIPTALGLALEDMDVAAIAEPLACAPTLTASLSEKYLKSLERERLDYRVIRKEADQRFKNLDDQGDAPNDEALKVLSSLIERNPGDLVLARDVAFSAMEFQKPAHAYHLLRKVVNARPFEPSNYMALGQCLAQLGKADMAMIYYEIAGAATFDNRSQDFKRIVATEYCHLLKEVVSGKVESNVKAFAKARLDSLTKKLSIAPSDLVVTMMWNTDQTDIDLHIIEPSGEECFYQHKNTKSGGNLTRDITDGYGPEMYKLAKAPKGDYKVLVKYYSGNQNRTDLRSKVYLTIHRNFGRENATVTRKSIQLSEVGGKEPVDTVTLK